MLFPVDNHSRDLLIHEYEDGDQQGGESGGKVNPPRVPSEGGNKPAPHWIRGLENKNKSAELQKADTCSFYLRSSDILNTDIKSQITGSLLCPSLQEVLTLSRV